MPNLVEVSRQEWWASVPPTIQEIHAGAAMRTASALEKIASSYDQLREDRDRYKRWHAEALEREARLARRVNALRGVITKLRRLAVREHRPKVTR